MTLIDAFAIVVMSMLGGGALACIVVGKVLDDSRITGAAQAMAGALAILVAILGAADWLS